MPSPRVYSSDAYSFSGLLFIERFTKDQVKNYFQVRGWELPEYKIFDSKEEKIKGDPVPYVVKNYSWNVISMESYMNDDYFEYQYMFEWLKDIQTYREYLYHVPNVVSNISLLILNTKENKISMGLKFIDAYPEHIATVRYQRDVTPITLNFTFRYRDVKLIPSEEYENVSISRI